MYNSDTSFFSKQPLFVLDHATLDIIDVNDAAIERYGYSRDEFLSMNINDLGEKKKRIDLIDKLPDDDASVDKVWVHKTKSGSKIYIQFTYHTFYHNEHPAKIAIAHDVSDQIAEQATKRTKFPKFVTHETNFPLAEVEWNDSLNVSNWSEKAQELFGWSEEEVIGEENFFEKLVSDDELEKAQQNLREAISNGESNYSVEGKANTKAGEQLVCEWHNSLIYDANDQLHSMHSLVTDVSKRKESENLFRTLSEKSLVGVFLIQDGRFQYVNPRLAEIVGYEQQEIIDNFHPHELIHPDDQETIKRNIRERLNGAPESEEYQVKAITKKGRVIEVSIYGARTQFRGRPAVVGTAVDVTKDKELVREYRSSIETFQQLFNSISDAVYIQDAEGTLLEVNQGTVEMYGYEKSMLKGQTPEVLAAPGKVDMDDMCEHITLALQGEPQSFNWWGRRKNGEVFPMEIVINRGKYFGKDVAITIARDISDRYQAEEKLRKNEELFRQLFQNAPIPIALLDKRQEIRQVNEAFSDTFGYTTKEVKRLNIDRLIVPESEKENADELSNTIFEGDPVYSTGQRLRKDGSLVDVLIYGVPVIVDGKTVAIFGIYVDITDRKQAEEKIRRSLKEKEVLLAEIHHRVKNNLAVITGLLELQAYNSDSEEAAQVLEISQMRVNSIALIHEKLYQNENLSEISFDQYLEELTEVIVSSLASSQTDIDICIEADPIKLTVNQAIPCGLILNEIVTNAHKHAFDGRNEGEIKIQLEHHDGNITMQISDDGVGLPEDITLDKPKSLGLKLIGTLSKQLEAEAEFTNRDDGTTFRLTFTLEE